MTGQGNFTQLAIEVVGRSQPCSPYTLTDALKKAGASHAVANRTMLELIRDGVLSRTFDGRLILPGFKPPPSPGRLVALIVFLVVVLAFMGWVFVNMLSR